MSRPQYIALCLIGAVSVLAYIEARSVAAALRNLTTPEGASKNSSGIV